MGRGSKSDWKPGNPVESFLTANGFTGHDQLDNHSLIHMGGRVYDPNLGRFLSADLFIQSPYDSQSYNRYSYTFNNPLSYTDPTGYMSDMMQYFMNQSYHQSTFWSWSSGVQACNCMVSTTTTYGAFTKQEDGSWLLNSDEGAIWTETTSTNVSSVFQTMSYNAPSWGVGPFRVYNFEPGIRQQCNGDAQCMQNMRIDEAQHQLGIMSLAVGGEGVLLAKVAWEARTAKVVAESLKLRQTYVNKVNALAQKANDMRKAGYSSEKIAKALHAERRALGEQYKNLTPSDMLNKIYARNLEKYGDKLGPSIDWLKGQGKSWDQIIESATRTGGKDLGL